MNVILIIDGGRVIGVHRTADGATHALAGHASNPTIGGSQLDIDILREALSGGTATVVYADAPDLTVERHAVLI